MVFNLALCLYVRTKRNIVCVSCVVVWDCSPWFILLTANYETMGFRPFYRVTESSEVISETNYFFWQVIKLHTALLLSNHPNTIYRTVHVLLRWISERSPITLAPLGTSKMSCCWKSHHAPSLSFSKPHSHNNIPWWNSDSVAPTSTQSWGDLLRKEQQSAAKIHTFSSELKYTCLTKLWAFT